MGSAKKRFYKAAGIEEDGAAYRLVLDGRPVRTPGGDFLAAPSETLARALAAEWEGQGAVISPRSMPLTRLLGSALDEVPSSRRRFVDRIAAYAETDLLCYRAESPPDLVVRQREGWDPLLGWLESQYGVQLSARPGVVPHTQDPQAIACLRGRVEAFDAIGLSALNIAVPALGSLVLALAVADGRLDGEAAFALSQIDETFQMEQWGRDEEALARRARLRDDVLAAALVLGPSAPA